jgi:hypothetical protein
MPVPVPCLARASGLVRSYVQYQQACRKCLAHCLASTRRHAAPQALELDSFSDLDPLCELSPTTGDRTEDTQSETASWLSDSPSSSDFDTDTDDFSMLTEEEVSGESGYEAGDDNALELSGDEGSEGDEPEGAPAFRLRSWVQSQIEQMYAHRYETPRDELSHGPSYM